MSTAKMLSFASGEVSPSLYARVDLVKYQTGLRTARNGTVLREGGFQSRAGTQYVCEVVPGFNTRLLPFVADNDNSFIITLDNQYIHFIQAGQYVQSASLTRTISAISLGSTTTVTTSVAHGYTSGRIVYLDGIVGTTQLNGRYFRIGTTPTTTTFTLVELKNAGLGNLNSSSYSAYVSGGTVNQIFAFQTPFLTDASIDLLDYAQDGNKLYLVHPSVAPRVLEWADTSNPASWTFSTIDFDITFSDMQASNITGRTGTYEVTYLVSAIEKETGEESEAREDTSVNQIGEPTVSNPIEITYTPPLSTTGQPLAYNIYRNVGGAIGFIGSTLETTFRDTGVVPDFTITPPIPGTRNLFNATNQYPSAVGLFQQRSVFGGTNERRNGVFLSKPGLPYNFTRALPITSGDAINFDLIGQRAIDVKYFLDLGSLVIFTNVAEYIPVGTGDGIITPTEINARARSSFGCGNVKPVPIGNTAIFLQARNSILRDLNLEFQTESYRGNDLTLFSSHLFLGKSIVDMAYSQIPNSNLFAVRSDGEMNVLTYVPEQQLLGWSHWDNDVCDFKRVATIPEDNEDVAYMVLNDDGGRGFIVRTKSRFINSVEDLVLMDAALSYDGTNTTATTMTLSGGTNWTFDETLTLTASGSYFVPSDVGNAIHIEDANGNLIRCTIVAYQSTPAVSVQPHKTVPTTLRNTARATWSKAVDQVSGLWHLEGRNVSVFADGFVVASPNNEAYELVTVTNGSITLSRPYAKIHVGLPFTVDFETLTLDRTDGETLLDKKKLVSSVHMQVYQTRGGFVGTELPSGTDPLQGLYELKLRNLEGYDEPTDLTSDTVEINVQATWNKNGRVFVRQVDPVPITISSVAPNGVIYE